MKKIRKRCPKCGHKRKKLSNGKYQCDYCRKDKKCHICGHSCYGYYCKKHRLSRKYGSPSRTRQSRKMRAKHEIQKNKKII